MYLTINCLHKVGRVKRITNDAFHFKWLDSRVFISISTPHLDLPQGRWPVAEDKLVDQLCMSNFSSTSIFGFMTCPSFTKSSMAYIKHVISISAWRSFSDRTQHTCVRGVTVLHRRLFHVCLLLAPEDRHNCHICYVIHGFIFVQSQTLTSSATFTEQGKRRLGSATVRRPQAEKHWARSSA